MGKVAELKTRADEVTFQQDGCLSDQCPTSARLKALVGNTLQLHRNVVTPEQVGLVLQQMLTAEYREEAIPWNDRGGDGTSAQKIICSRDVFGAQTQKDCDALCENNSNFPYTSLRMNCRTKMPSSFVIGKASVYAVEDAFRARMQQQWPQRTDFQELPAVNNLNFHTSAEVPMHIDRYDNGGVGEKIATVVLRAAEPSTIVLATNDEREVYKFTVGVGDAWCMLDGNTDQGRELHGKIKHGVCTYAAPNGKCRGTECTCRVVQNIRLGRRSFK